MILKRNQVVTDNKIITETISIRLDETKQIPAAMIFPEDHGERKSIAIILAHGAENDMNHPLLVSVAHGLAQAGCLALRFNFPYRNEGRKSPDSQKTLIRTWQSVCRFLKEGSGYRVDTLIAAGKSMGGRVASQMASEGLLPADRLIFLGYPLHAPGNKVKLRDEHLYRITIPMLFFAGTRDPLCDLILLRKVLSRLQAPWELEVIEGGDHSLHPLKKAGIPQQDIYEVLLRKIKNWLRV